MFVAFKSRVMKLLSTLESSMGTQHATLELPGPTSAVAVCRDISRVAVASATQVRQPLQLLPRKSARVDTRLLSQAAAYFLF